MTLLWPDWLWTLLLLPALVLLYLRLLARRKKNSVRLASVAIVRQAMGPGPGWRRHVPPLLLLAALAMLLFATARPVVKLKLPARDQTIILAMDVSGSMRATDVKPNRMVAAQEAAKAFTAGLPRNVRIGVVSFAGTAAVVQAPTQSREDVVAAIDRFQMQRATAIGSGLILSLATLFPDAGIDLSQITGARAILDTAHFPTALLGHVGDGNFHAVLLIDPENPQEIAEAERLNDEIVRLAIAMDGTCTGEHGIGLHKIGFLVEEAGEDAIDLMRGIKRAFDPDGLLNPGKIFRL
jgi:FAD/FMN-containing dehydrogenase